MRNSAQSDGVPEPIQSDVISDQEIFILMLYMAGQIKKNLAVFANLKKIFEAPGQQVQNRGYRSPGESAAS